MPFFISQQRFSAAWIIFLLLCRLCDNEALCLAYQHWTTVTDWSWAAPKWWHLPPKSTTGKVIYTAGWGIFCFPPFSTAISFLLQQRNDSLNCATHYDFPCGVVCRLKWLGLGETFLCSHHLTGNKKEIQHCFICINPNTIQLWLKWKEISHMSTMWYLSVTICSCVKLAHEWLGNTTTTCLIWYPKCKQSQWRFSPWVIKYLRCIASLQHAALQPSWHNPDYVDVGGEWRLPHHHEWFRYNCTDRALVLLFCWRGTKGKQIWWCESKELVLKKIGGKGGCLRGFAFDFTVDHCYKHESMKMNAYLPFKN